MSNLTILNTAIRQTDNLFNLNDLHRAGGNQSRHKPSNFTRLDTTQELIAEIQKEDLNAMPLKVLRGTQGGTYACMEIALAYAMWIDPKFHLIVLRAYMAMKDVSQNNQRNLPLVEEKKYTLELTEYELRKLCWLWKMAEIMRSLLYILYEPLNALGSRHSGAAYGYSREYQFSIEESRKILLRATADIQPHKFDADWNRVLPELRKGKVNNY